MGHIQANFMTPTPLEVNSRLNASSGKEALATSRRAQIAVKNIFWVKVGDRNHRIEVASPNSPPLGVRECPKRSQRRRVGKVLP
jgi:hypothetical protein